MMHRPSVVAAIFFALGLTGVRLCSALFPTGGAHRKNSPGLLYWSGDRSQKKIALTFDDGPSEPYTGEILAILREHHVRATFFLVGVNVKRHPGLACEIVEEGHVVGNHGMTHTNWAHLSEKKLETDMLESEQTIFEATDVRPQFFRPPFGRLDSRVLHFARQMGWTVVEWTISPRDWANPPEEKIVARILSRVQNGSIILLHDGMKTSEHADCRRTVEALPFLIEELKARGYALVTVPELLDLPSPRGV